MQPSVASPVPGDARPTSWPGHTTQPQRNEGKGEQLLQEDMMRQSVSYCQLQVAEGKHALYQYCTAAVTLVE